jgi:hypothetical protein
MARFAWTPLPRFFVSVDSKRLEKRVNPLESTLVRSCASVDSKEVRDSERSSSESERGGTVEEEQGSEKSFGLRDVTRQFS